MKDPHQCPDIVGFYKMAGFIRFHLIDHTDLSDPSFHCDNIAAIITASRSKNDFIKPSLLIRTGYNLLPDMRRDEESIIWASTKDLNNLKPRKRYGMNEFSFRRFAFRNQNCVEKESGKRGSQFGGYPYSDRGCRYSNLSGWHFCYYCSLNTSTLWTRQLFLIAIDVLKLNATIRAKIIIHFESSR